jgi:hypothetical protein
MLKRTLLAATAAATINPSLAGAIDASTPCSVAVQAFDSDKHGGQVLAGAPSQQVLEVSHPDRTIYQAADSVYHSLRDIHTQLGIIK